MAAGIEWALSSGEIEFTTSTTVAFGGAIARVTRNGVDIPAYRAVTVSAGDVISIESLIEGRFLYVAFGGVIDIEPVMRSRSTYVPSTFGGLEGRRLRNGDEIHIGGSHRTKHYVTDLLPDSLRPRLRSEVIRFIPREPVNVLGGTWQISSASDRTGYRLTGNTVDGGASITSQPVAPGTIQLPPGGEPIVLMADAPTVGGYRIIGCVFTADLGILAQLSPGESVMFEQGTVESAQREILNDAERIERIREWSLS